MGNGGLYHGGHGGAGKDLPPLKEIDTCSMAGPSRIRYNENDLPQVCRGGKGLPNKNKQENPKALEPPFKSNPTTMTKSSAQLKDYKIHSGSSGSKGQTTQKKPSY